MSYNGSGTFNLAAGNPVVTATTISSTWANNTLSDVATGLSNVICRDGQSTTTASIGFAAGIAVTGGIARFPAGSVGSPSVYLSTDSTTGLYRSALNNLDVAVGGANVLNIAASAITMGSGVTFAAGAVTATTGTFTSTVTLSGTAANIATGSNYISNGGTDAGLSLDASNNATLSGDLLVGGGTGTRLAAVVSTQNGQEVSWRATGKSSGGSDLGIKIGVGISGDFAELYNSATSERIASFSGANTTLAGTLTVSGGTVTLADPTDFTIGSATMQHDALTTSYRLICTTGDATFATSATNTDIYVDAKRYLYLQNGGVTSLQVQSGSVLSTGSTTALSLATSGGTQAEILNTNSVATHIALKGGTTGNGAQIQALGETNTNMELYTNGTGVYRFFTNLGAAVEQVRIIHTASAVNYLKFTGQITAGNPIIAVDGETNVGLNIWSKGTGNIFFETNGGAATQAAVMHVAGATRYLKLFGNNGGDPKIDTSAGMLHLTGASNTNKVYVNSTSNSFGQFQVGNTTSDGEASIGFISGVTSFGTSPVSTNGSTRVWALGTATGALANGSWFGLYNENLGVNVACWNATGQYLVGTDSSISGAAAARVEFVQGGSDCLWVKNTSSGSAVEVVWNASTTGDSYFMAFATEATLTVRGSIDYNRGGGLVRYNTTSDERLKIDRGIATMPLYLPNLRIHDFDWKESGSRGRGVFAQEAYDIFPDAISVGSDGCDLSKPWGASYSAYVPDLIVGWQNHEARIKALEARLQ